MNSELYNNKYRIPSPIMMKLNAKLINSSNSNGEGIKRAKNLLKGGIVTYQQLKRLKNFFDHFNPEKQSLEEYELAGGRDMQNWIEEILKTERKKTEISKDVKAPLNTTNQFSLPTANISKIHESEKKDNEDNKLKKNSLAVIFNSEKRILLLKRSSYPDQWQPSKWGLVGGGVEDGEDPMIACKREIKEETGLVINTLIEKTVLQRNSDSVEHIYVGKYEGDPFNIKLDKENQGYAWLSYNEIKFLDTVPNLIDYINIAIKDYE